MLTPVDVSERDSAADDPGAEARWERTSARVASVLQREPCAVGFRGFRGLGFRV